MQGSQGARPVYAALIATQPSACRAMKRGRAKDGKGKGDGILICMGVGPVTLAWRSARARAGCAASIAVKSYGYTARKGLKTLEKRF